MRPYPCARSECVINGIQQYPYRIDVYTFAILWFPSVILIRRKRRVMNSFSIAIPFAGFLSFTSEQSCSIHCNLIIDTLDDENRVANEERRAFICVIVNHNELPCSRMPT